MFSRSIFESLTDAQILPLGLICAKQMMLVALMPCLKICFSFFWNWVWKSCENSQQLQVLLVGIQSTNRNNRLKKGKMNALLIKDKKIHLTSCILLKQRMLFLVSISMGTTKVLSSCSWRGFFETKNLLWCVWVMDGGPNQTLKISWILEIVGDFKSLGHWLLCLRNSHCFLCLEMQLTQNLTLVNFGSVRKISVWIAPRKTKC